MPMNVHSARLCCVWLRDERNIYIVRGGDGGSDRSYTIPLRQRSQSRIGTELAAKPK